MGRWMSRLAWGDDTRPVSPQRAAKSRGSERTFATDVSDVGEMLEVLGVLEAARRGTAPRRFGMFHAQALPSAPSRSTSSMIAIGAASPARSPSLITRV